MELRTLLRTFFTPLVIGSAFFIALLLFIATLGMLWWTRPGPSAAGPGTAVLNVIPAPTNTPVPPTAAPLASPTPGNVPPVPVEGEIAVGTSVQIKGTAGDGLRLRSVPGLAGDVLLVGAEAEVFLVQDGPRQADGYTWWFLLGVNDPQRQGWAVSNFLQRVQQP
jgi:hypothetical protein